MTIRFDCDADPFVPEGWSVVEHRKGGPFAFDANGIMLYLDPVQETERIVGIELRRKLAGQPVLNANALDFLLANPGFIPDSWKLGCIFFWGTVYFGLAGNLCVRCLYWRGGQRRWDYRRLDDTFGSQHPAAARRLQD